MLEFTGAINAALKAHRAAALTTVVKVAGRGPVRLGTKMVVTHDGQRSGSLGAPELDEQAQAQLGRVMERRQPTTQTFELPQGQSVEVFFELFMPPPTLIVVGAGHIALPLAAMAKMLEYEVVVIDDRTTFANRGRFPTADRIM
ncbi:MAG: XdhC family protein, partial [Chloroflexota bacterium]